LSGPKLVDVESAQKQEFISNMVSTLGIRSLLNQLQPGEFLVRCMQFWRSHGGPNRNRRTTILVNCRIARKAGAVIKILRSYTIQYSKFLSREYLFPSLVVVSESTLGIPLRRVSRCPGTDVNNFD
jgi:hypothetical protein